MIFKWPVHIFVSSEMPFKSVTITIRQSLHTWDCVSVEHATSTCYRLKTNARLPVWCPCDDIFSISVGKCLDLFQKYLMLCNDKKTPREKKQRNAFLSAN